MSYTTVSFLVLSLCTCFLSRLLTFVRGYTQRDLLLLLFVLRRLVPTQYCILAEQVSHESDRIDQFAKSAVAADAAADEAANNERHNIFLV